MVPRYTYFHRREPLRFDYQGSYDAPDAPLQSVEDAWMHDLGEIVGAVLGAGTPRLPPSFSLRAVKDAD